MKGAATRSDQFDPALLAGIAAYRRHPYRRAVDPKPIVWAEGDTTLRDYGPQAGIPMLLVPSLINRAHVLDLTPDASMLRFLSANGIRPLLLDWGWPGEAERRFTLADYVAGRLDRALAAATALAGRVVLSGYCMGGLLAVAAAVRRPEAVRALALLASPWDFHRPDPTVASQFAAAAAAIRPALDTTGTLPIDLLQLGFAALDPEAVPRRYRAFARLPQGGARARLFVALEDWANDGVPLAAPVARDCLRDWYGRNLPARGLWQVAGQAIDPAGLRVPAFVAVPGRDRVVPPASALALAGLIPGARLHRPNAGHVGMVAGSRAEAALWQPLLAWLRSLNRHR